MSKTNGRPGFGILAREVFSWDSAILWIAQDDPGRQPLMAWRDAATELATMSGQPIAVDPLLLMLAESREDIYNRSDSADPHHLRFVVLAYGNYAQIVAKLKPYSQLNIGIGLAGNAYQVGIRLAGLLDSAEDSGVEANASVPERQCEELRVCSAR